MKKGQSSLFKWLKKSPSAKDDVGPQAKVPKAGEESETSAPADSSVPAGKKDPAEVPSASTSSGSGTSESDKRLREIIKKRKYEEKRVRLYVPTWEKTFSWVRHDPEKDQMYCTVCREFPDIADKSSNLFIGTSSYRIRSLQTHDKATEHLRCLKASERQANPEKKGPMDVVVEKLDAEEQKRLNVLFNTAFYVAKKKVAFGEYSDLMDLQEKNGVDVGTQYRNSKQCRDFISHIAEVSIFLVHFSTNNKVTRWSTRVLISILPYM